MNKASSIWMGQMYFGVLQPLTDQVWSSSVVYVFIFFNPRGDKLRPYRFNLVHFGGLSRIPPTPFCAFKEYLSVTVNNDKVGCIDTAKRPATWVRMAAAWAQARHMLVKSSLSLSSEQFID